MEGLLETAADPVARNWKCCEALLGRGLALFGRPAVFLLRHDFKGAINRDAGCRSTLGAIYPGINLMATSEAFPGTAFSTVVVRRS